MWEDGEQLSVGRFVLRAEGPLVNRQLCKDTACSDGKLRKE